jgi:hypothetical protein
MESGDAIAVNGSDVYIAGTFLGEGVSFGPTTLRTTKHNSDLFVAKLADAGTSAHFVWVQPGGGKQPGRCAVKALAVSGTSVYVAGSFRGTNVAVGQTALSSAAADEFGDLFVAKLTDAGATGAFSWALRAGGSSRDDANALAVNGTSVYVAGDSFSPTADFGRAGFTRSKYANSFVAKLLDAGPTGAFVWVAQTHNTDIDEAQALAVSGTSVYVAGAFRDTARFGRTALVSAGSRRTEDVYVAKLTDAGPTGSFTWAYRAGGAGDERAYGLAVCGPGVYLTGTFANERLDNTTRIGSTTLTSAGAGDIFVAKLTDAGPTADFAWAQHAGGTEQDDASCIAVNEAGVCVGGTSYSASARFGSQSLANQQERSVGFIARLVP